MRTGKVALMRIYTDERAKADGSPLYQVIVERARTEKLAGLTVLRGVVGFGVSGNVQRASILDLSGNLPLVIELVDEEAKLRAFWHRLEWLGDIGLVTLEEVEVMHYGRREIPASSAHDDEAPPTQQAYRVERVARSADRYYLLASSPLEAIEIVTMRLADLEGRNAWRAVPQAPSFALEKGDVRDGAGREVKLQSA